MINQSINLKKTFRFFIDSNYREDPIQSAETIRLIEELTNRKTNVRVKILCSSKCIICNDQISEVQYSSDLIQKSNCNCTRSYHKSCLQLQVKTQKDRNIHSILTNLNKVFSCISCKSDSFDQSNILKVVTKNDVILSKKPEQELLNEQQMQENENNKDNEKEQEQKDDENLACPICFDDLDMRVNGYKLDCGCIFCRGCLVQDFKEKIKEINVEIDKMKCNSCNKILQFNDIINILKEEKEVLEQIEYKNIKTFYQNMKRENPNCLEQLVECQGKYIKDENNGEILFVNQKDINQVRQGKKAIAVGENQKVIDCNFTFIQDISTNEGKVRHKCNKCKYEFCLNGCDDDHKGQTCAQYRQSKLDKTDLSREQYEALGFKFCPSCQTLSFKDSGCNRIICQLCKKSYCHTCYFLANTPGEVYAHLQAVHGGYY